MASDFVDGRNLVITRRKLFPVVNLLCISVSLACAYLIYWRQTASQSYYFERCEAERRYEANDPYKEFGGHVIPLRKQPKKVQDRWYPAKPGILGISDEDLAAVVFMFMTCAGWLSLQAAWKILQFALMTTCRNVAKAIQQGKSDTVRE